MTTDQIVKREINKLEALEELLNYKMDSPKFEWVAIFTPRSKPKKGEPPKSDRTMIFDFDFEQLPPVPEPKEGREPKEKIELPFGHNGLVLVRDKEINELRSVNMDGLKSLSNINCVLLIIPTAEDAQQG